MHAAAMAEDPSVFDYDGVYDSMQVIAAPCQPDVNACRRGHCNEQAMPTDHWLNMWNNIGDEGSTCCSGAQKPQQQIH